MDIFVVGRDVLGVLSDGVSVFLDLGLIGGELNIDVDDISADQRNICLQDTDIDVDSVDLGGVRIDFRRKRADRTLHASNGAVLPGIRELQVGKGGILPGVSVVEVAERLVDVGDGLGNGPDRFNEVPVNSITIDSRAPDPLVVLELVLQVDDYLHELLILGLKLSNLVVCLLHVAESLDVAVDLVPQELSAVSCDAC